MAQGGLQAQRTDFIRSVDPRLDGFAAKKGALYRFIPVSGTPELLIKVDDGFTKNWEPVGGATAEPAYVDVASTGDVDIGSAPATIDGVAYATVLLKDQASQPENGVYDFNGTGNPLTRSTGWDTAAEFTPGREVFVDGGNTQADTLWENTNPVVTIDVTPIVFQLVSSVNFMLRDFSNANPAANNIDLDGHKLVNVLDPTLDQDAATKKYVDDSIAVPLEYQVSSNSPYPQVQDAIDQAVTDGAGVGLVKAIIKIAPGIYVEDLTLASGITLQADSQNTSIDTVTIQGQHTYAVPGTGSSTQHQLYFAGITFTDSQAAGDLISITGANSYRVRFSNCYMSKDGAAGSVVNCSAANGALDLLNCEIRTSGGTTAAAIISSAAGTTIRNSNLNTADAPCADYTGAGQLEITDSILACNAAYVVDVQTGGMFSLGCVLTSTLANADGIRTGAGVQVTMGNQIINSPVGAGFAVQGTGILAAVMISLAASEAFDPGLTIVGLGASVSPGNFAIKSSGDINTLRTITPGGTTGDQTINKPQGTVNFAGAQAVLTVTNSLVNVNSVILCTIQTDDLTAVLKNVVPNVGGFDINMDVAPTAETRVAFLVLN